MKKLIGLILALAIAFTCFAAMPISANAAIIDGDGGITDGNDDFDDTIAKNVMELINAIGTVTKDSKTAIETARTAYDALNDAQKALVTNYATLTAAEEAYAGLAPTIIKGDMDGDEKVTVSDVVEMRKCIMAASWTADQLTAGDYDGNATLTVSDVIALRQQIMSGTK